MALGKERPQALHLLVRQPKQVLVPVSSRSLSQIAVLNSMGPDPSMIIVSASAPMPQGSGQFAAIQPRADSSGEAAWGTARTNA